MSGVRGRQRRLQGSWIGMTDAARKCTNKRRRDREACFLPRAYAGRVSVGGAGRDAYGAGVGVLKMGLRRQSAAIERWSTRAAVRRDGRGV
jgi:hypothetical protein